MGKAISLSIDEGLKTKSSNFTKNIKSGMTFKSDLSSDINSLEWLDLIEEVCPYLDNIVRTPKVALVSESEVTKIEKAKKTSVDTVKDLSKHTDYIDKIDPVTGDVLPSKLLVVFREETFNTYENRFIYTLILNLLRFLTEKEELLKDLKPKNDKTLEYSASTSNGRERVKVDIKISTKPTKLSDEDNDLEKEINSVKKRIAKMKKFVNSWLASELITSLQKQHAVLVMPPIKKTNLILKNPNFQMATKLWDFLYSVDENKNKNINGLDSKGDELLRSILDDSFLMDYYVMDSISINKKDQKDKLCKYALLMIMNQVQRAIDILLQNGIKISEQELLKLLNAEIEKKKSISQIGSADIKKKFQKEMDDYLALTSQYL
jgi:hypothetical protein